MKILYTKLFCLTLLCVSGADFAQSSRTEAATQDPRQTVLTYLENWLGNPNGWNQECSSRMTLGQHFLEGHESEDTERPTVRREPQNPLFNTQFRRGKGLEYMTKALRSFNRQRDDIRILNSGEDSIKANIILNIYNLDSSIVFDSSYIVRRQNGREDCVTLNDDQNYIPGPLNCIGIFLERVYDEKWAGGICVGCKRRGWRITSLHPRSPIFDEGNEPTPVPLNPPIPLSHQPSRLWLEASASLIEPNAGTNGGAQERQLPLRESPQLAFGQRSSVGNPDANTDNEADEIQENAQLLSQRGNARSQPGITTLHPLAPRLSRYPTWADVASTLQREANAMNGQTLQSNRLQVNHRRPRKKGLVWTEPRKP